MTEPTPEPSKYNGQPEWSFCIDTCLAEEGEVRIYEPGEAEPIAVTKTFAEAMLVCNAVNRIRTGYLIEPAKLKADIIKELELTESADPETIAALTAGL